MWLQAEHERKRILQRLKEAREARTKPHQARWFDFHPQVLHKNLTVLHGYPFANRWCKGSCVHASTY